MDKPTARKDGDMKRGVARKRKRVVQRLPGGFSARVPLAWLSRWLQKIQTAIAIWLVAPVVSDDVFARDRGRRKKGRRAVSQSEKQLK